jgi:hypothetical protein
MPRRKTVQRGMWSRDVVSFRLPEEAAEYLAWCEAGMLEKVIARCEAQARRILCAAGLPDDLEGGRLSLLIRERGFELAPEDMAERVLVHADELRRALDRNDARTAAEAGMRLQEQADSLHFSNADRAVLGWQRQVDAGRKRSSAEMPEHEHWLKLNRELLAQGVQNISERARRIAKRTGAKEGTIRSVLYRKNSC